MPLQLPDEQPSHQVEFVDEDGLMLFEILVYNAPSFTGAIEFAQQDAKLLTIDLGRAAGVNVKKYVPA